MGINLSFILLCCVVLLRSVRNISAAEGFGVELILNKLDFLQHKMDGIEQGMISRDQKMNLLQGQLANIERVIKDNAIATKVKDEALQNTLTSLIFVLDNKLIAKISNLQRKLDVLERTIQDENDAVRRRDESLQSKINAMEISLKTRSDTLMEVLLGMKTAMTTAANMLKMNSTSIHLELKQSVNQQKEQYEGAKILPQTTLPGIYQSCMEEPTKVSGKYAIQLQKESQKLISVYCEQSAHGGGWIVFQHRFNGKEDFYRNWADYRDGFGSLDGEFWLGLESLHQLTSSRKHELMVEVNDTRGNYGYAHYDHFEIGDESEKFKLKIVGRSKGTARDTLKQRLGDKFTTKDEDNDRWFNGNCAVSWKGGWWYDSCGSSDLNGPYANSRKQPIAMIWDNFGGRPLTYTRMMIRNVD